MTGLPTKPGDSLFADVDELLIRILGKWCDHCERVTGAYKGESGAWPCCDGCWHPYAYWDTHSDFGVLKEAS